MDIKFKNLVSEAEFTLGKDISGYVLESYDFGQAGAKHVTTQYIDLIGSNVDSTIFSERDISFTGWTKAASSTEMKIKKTELNRFFNPKHDIQVQYGEYTIVVRPNSSIQYSKDSKDNTSTFCRFLIECTAYIPVFKRINEEVFYYSEANKVPLFPLKIPKNKGICFGKISTINTTNVLNDGDIEAGFIIRFIAYKGAIINPKITNNKTGKFIEVIVSMEKGDIVEVSTETGNKYAKFIRGTTETDIFRLISKKSTMSMTLNTGVNDLAITAAQNASNLNNIIKFVPLYLEVQE